MHRSDILRFYAHTPIWFWPVLWWSLRALEADMAARIARGESVLAEIFCNEYGRLRVRWIARVAAPKDWQHTGPTVLDSTNLDAWAKSFEAAVAPQGLTRLWLPLSDFSPTYPTSAPLEPG